ncbi:YcgL domain-containing protein [Seminibacterium arietis]|uniref:YcgL domain-containing protein ACFQ02_02670 n=1 Tax=Seminibacterium arietis TaxID=1173502 RepID=A0ABW3I741_9PAST
MLCAIYKTNKKEGMYLYIEKRENFDSVPQALLDSFGKPIFVMLFNLASGKPLINARNEEVQQQIKQNGFYLQMPKQQENLLEQEKKYKNNQ